jgi:hypothetical protein
LTVENSVTQATSVQGKLCEQQVYRENFASKQQVSRENFASKQQLYRETSTAE